MSLVVTKPGILSLIQDFGRYGLQKLGVTCGGPLDEHAYLWANHLLGNHYNSATLEISMGGFSARFTKRTMIAICGADLSASLNGQTVEPWQTYYVSDGDEIAFASPKCGLRSYLAVKGGFLVKPQFSSCATVLRENLGGLYQTGKKLAGKDSIAFDAHHKEMLRRVPDVFITKYTPKIQIRFIPNYSIIGVDEFALQNFIQQTFRITSQIDRMGYRLEGKAIASSTSGITSQGIPVGAIQLPQDGQPIVLMKDKQTMGGYPLLGCVAYLDIAKLAQGMPGDEVNFIPVNIESMEKELLDYRRFFHINW